MVPVPPCFDTYVWVEPVDRAATLRSFIEAYVDVVRPRSPQFEAFVRTYVDETPDPGDEVMIEELRRGEALAIYVRALKHFDATMTLTREGAVVLGLSVDDPDNDPRVWKRGEKLAKVLMTQLGAVAAMGGVEVPPPRSRREWSAEERTEFRLGTVG